MPVSLGVWRARIGTFMRRRGKEYDYNYFWRKLQNLIKKNKKAEPPKERNNSECNISSRTGSTLDANIPPGNTARRPASSCNVNLNTAQAGPSCDVNNRANSETSSQCDGPDCDTVKESGSSCDVNSSGLNDVSHSESSRAENSGSSIDKETKPVPDTTDVKIPVPHFYVDDELDNRHITINLMSREQPPNSAQLSKTAKPEVSTSEWYSDVCGETGLIRLDVDDTSNSAPSGIENQSSGLSPKSRLDTTRNTGQTTSSLREVTEYHGSPTYPALRSGTTSAEADAIILLLRSGDVERNPGPNDKAGWSLDLEREVLSLVKDVSPGRYYDLCNALDISHAQSQGILTKNLLDYSNSLFEVICIWGLKQRDGTNYKTLLADKLRSLHLDALGTKLVEGGYSTQDTPTQCQVGDHVPSMTEEEIQRVAEEVKRHLRIHLCHIQTDPLNSELQVEFDRIFTNLTMMEEDKGTKRKTPVLYEDLLRTKVNGIYPKRLLVEGEGGVGKTTFCAKIAWDWIHEKGYQDFKLVLVILLRKAEDKTVGEIVKSYLPDDNPVTAKQLDEYILSNPKDVFLALDGLDEFAVDLNSLQQIALIILNRLFKSGTVLITSRQWRSDVIRKNADLRKVFAFITVEGFSAENLSSYIMKFFHPDTDSSKDLNRFISNNDVIRENMAPYPIYAAMLCIMWKEFDGDRREAMSKLQTFSKLFNEMIDFLVDHYLSKHIPSGIVEGKLREKRSYIRHRLLQIGHIAFKGLLERRLVFTEEEFQIYPESIDIGCKVGVLTREKKVLPRRDRGTNPNSAIRSVQFPHKLFQEYLSGMYLAFLYKSNRNEYDGLIVDIIEADEYQYQLYFTSAQQKEVGLDIVSRLIAERQHDGSSDDGSSSEDGSRDDGNSDDGSNDDGIRDFGIDDDEFIIDVAYESQDQAVAKAVADHLSESSKTLKITEEMRAHTVSGHIFIASHREVDDLIIEKSCGRTASEDLAEFMCSSRSLRYVKIASTMHDVFYSVLANKAVDSKIETLDISLEELSKPPSASRDLAQFICKMPHLKKLKLIGGYQAESVWLHDDFYSTSSSIASSAKIETLEISLDDLSERPSASRNLAQFICKMPHLKNLKLNRRNQMVIVWLHDDFYSTSSSIASSAKIETLDIQLDDLRERPFASRGLAQFICKMPHLKNLTLNWGDPWYTITHDHLHDDFYSTSSLVASSARIKTLNIPLEDLGERPSASRDLAQFICKMPHLKNLTLRWDPDPDDRSNSVSLHDDFYSTSSSIASSAKIETLNIWLEDLSERPSASCDLAQFICKMRHLKELTLNGRNQSNYVSLHDDFYSTSSSIASSAKIETLNICFEDLSGRSSASRDLVQVICKMPHLKDLTLNVMLHDDFYSTSSSIASSAKSGNTSPTLTELTVDDQTLQGWQDCGSMFDDVKRVTIQVWGTINYGVIQRIHLPGATELTIQTHEYGGQPADFRTEPTSLPNALLNISPQLVKVTFSDLYIGNGTVELILQAFRSPHNLKHLKSIRFIRCGTDKRVDDVTAACNEDQVLEVEVQHGKPRGEYFDE